MYTWTLVPGSLHYDTIAAQLTALKTKYENNLRPYNDTLDELNAEIAAYDQALEVTASYYRKWLIQEKNLNKELSELNLQKSETENNIEDKATAKAEYDNIV